MHYNKSWDHLVYGSEIKSIYNSPAWEKFNYDTLNNYLSFHCCASNFLKTYIVYCPDTIYGTKTENKSLTAIGKPCLNRRTIWPKHVVDKIEKVFCEFCGYHKISDVEVGCFLRAFSGVIPAMLFYYFRTRPYRDGFDFGWKIQRNRLCKTHCRY